MTNKIAIGDIVEGIAILDTDCNYVYVNGTDAVQAKISDRDRSGITIFDKKSVDESSEFFRLCQSVMKDRMTREFETEKILPNGTKKWYRVNIAPIPDGVLIISMDITDKKLEEMHVFELLKAAEDRVAELNTIAEAKSHLWLESEEYKKLKSSFLKEEILLHELFHRTKNNLQIISSMLRMKAASLNDKEMISILNDMISRIKTIAEIHDYLHLSDNFTIVDLKSYITAIVNLLNRGLSDQSEKIVIKPELTELSVGLDIATYCGIIINELITNSLKHAFPGDRKGTIMVRISRLNDKIELQVSDDGIGFARKDIYEGKMGMQILQLIAKDQLNGEISMDTGNGVTATIGFRLPE